MISVLPIKDKNRLENLYNKNGIAFSEKAWGVSADCDGEALGYCLFDLDKKSMTVHILEPKDILPLADGVLRSALHIAAERSVMDVKYSKSAPEELLISLGFVLDREEQILDIDKLFGGCGCKNKKN